MPSIILYGRFDNIVKQLIATQLIHTCTHTYKHTYIQTEGHTDRHTCIYTDIYYTYRHPYIHTYIYIHTYNPTYRHADIDTYIHTYGQTGRHTEQNTHTDIHTYIHTHAQTHLHAHTHTYIQPRIHTCRQKRRDQNGCIKSLEGQYIYRKEAMYKYIKQESGGDRGILAGGHTGKQRDSYIHENCHTYRHTGSHTD